MKRRVLIGDTLPIKLASHGNALGYYQYVGEKKFGFKHKYFNDPNTKETESVDVIRREYAHYYVDATNISRYFTRKGSSLAIMPTGSGRARWLV